MTTTAENPWLRMALNNAWANQTLYAAFADLPAGGFAAPRTGFFPSLARTMNHIYEVDLYYLDALSRGGRGRSVFDRHDVRDAGELGELQAQSDMQFTTICREVTPEFLASTVETERKEGIVTENVAALVLHLVQHQIHHRGQAHLQLSEAGVAPPQLDDFYLEYGRVPSAAAYW